MKILLCDFNAKVGQEDIFKPTIGKESLHVRLVNFATSKNLIVKNTTFPHRNIHKQTWTSPDGLTHNQTDHILIDKRRQSSTLDIRSFILADCDSDHYLLIAKKKKKIRERLSIAKRVDHTVDIKRFNVGKLKDEEIKLKYQVQISNMFDAIITSSEDAGEVDINKMWENIKDNIKVTAGERICYYEVKKKEPWFDAGCSNRVKRRKQAKLKFFRIQPKLMAIIITLILHL